MRGSNPETRIEGDESKGKRYVTVHRRFNVNLAPRRHSTAEIALAGGRHRSIPATLAIKRMNAEEVKLTGSLTPGRLREPNGAVEGVTTGRSPR